MKYQKYVDVIVDFSFNFPKQINEVSVEKNSIYQKKPRESNV